MKEKLTQEYVQKFTSCVIGVLEGLIFILVGSFITRINLNPTIMVVFTTILISYGISKIIANAIPLFISVFSRKKAKQILYNNMEKKIELYVLTIILILIPICLQATMYEDIGLKIALFGVCCYSIINFSIMNKKIKGLKKIEETVEKDEEDKSV